MNESASQADSAAAEAPEPKWQPISAIDRRVLGVLAEKAKTTPDQYPLSLNGLRTGCNQKSNRDPTMDLDTDAIEDSLDRLRQLGAVTEIQGGGRVSKYRHRLYEWLGVDKVELAVMAELLLRGAQTEGELRGRAARMEPIADLTALRPIVAALKSRGLIVPLTPEGRGHTLTHGLYTPVEMERLRQKFGDAPVSASTPPAASSAPASAAPPAVVTQTAPAEDTDSLRRELQDARAQISDLERQMTSLEERLDRTEDELRGLKESLGA